MLGRIIQEKSTALRIMKYAVLMAIVFASCLDFKFESEYEDINGIYLEYIASYDIYGDKIVTNDNLGFIINVDTLLIYDFENVDSISLSNTYNASGWIRDFTLDGEYAYLGTYSRLEIVHLSEPNPNLSGVLYRTGVDEIRIVGNRAYLLSGPYRNMLDIVNITEKTNPVLIDSIVFDDVIIQIEADSDFAYVLLDNGNFHVIDIAEPSLPVFVCMLTNDTISIESFTLDGDYLHFSCWYYAAYAYKLLTCTLSDNHELTQVSEIDCPTWFRPLKIDGFYGLGLAGSSYSYLFELIDHARPYIAEQIISNDYVDSGTMEGTYIYILSPLRIIEIKQVVQ